MSIVVVSQDTDQKQQVQETPNEESQEQATNQETEESQESDSLQENEDEETEQEDEGASEDDEEAQGEDERKSAAPKGVQKRINKLTKQRTDAQRRAEYLEQRLRDAESKLNSQSQKPAETQAQKPVRDDGRPIKPKADQFEDFDSYEIALDQYFEDLSDWKSEQKIKSYKSEQTQQEVFKAHQERVKQAREKYPDFEEVMENVASVEVTDEVKHQIMQDPKSMDLLYHIAQKGEEYAERLNQMNAIDRAREFGRIEALIDSQNTSTSQTTTNKKEASKAPRPPKPVSSRGSGSKKSIYDPSLSQREYEELRRAEEANRY